jgi:hypothetical protein
MKLKHTEINVRGNGIINGEEMDGNGLGLTDADSATTSLVNNGGIPVLREEEDPSAEL